MYGEWIMVNLGDDIECKVWVACVPSTPNEVLQRLAINTIKSRLPEKKTGIAAGMEAMSLISDYEYSQGRGPRHEAEQALKRALIEMSENGEDTITVTINK